MKNVVQIVVPQTFLMEKEIVMNCGLLFMENIFAYNVVKVGKFGIIIKLVNI